MNAEEKSSYFKELAGNLQHEGFTVGPEADGFLPVELDGQRLCLAMDTGKVRYWKEDVFGDSRSAALDRVTDIVKTTAEYMSQMEAAPQLGVGPEGDYRLLADFNNIVLAGHPTQYGVQFVTWERVQEGAALYQGDYYGPSGGADSYTAAKQDFATRSGLIPRSALFTPEQMTEGEKAVVTLSRLEKNPSVDYLYRIGVGRDNSISWSSSMQFCGVYDREHRALYLTQDSLRILMDGKFPLVTEAGPSMAEEISRRVNERVESTIANDRNNLSQREVTGWQASRDLEYYRNHGVKESAVRQFFSNQEPDGQFHSDYKLDELPETAFIAYITDPELFVQTEAEQYIKSNQEKFLLQFLKTDALLAEYQALVQDTGNPIHRMKAIMTSRYHVTGWSRKTQTERRSV